jgi:hypothetical protein
LTDQLAGTRQGLWLRDSHKHIVQITQRHSPPTAKLNIVRVILSLAANLD